MKKNTFSIAVAIIAFAFIFIACGGEDCTGEDCNEPTDETSVTDEEIDQNQISDSDILIEDTETNDEDSVTVPCDQDPTCQEVCKNFLVFAGNWSMIEIVGDATITLSVDGAVCKISVTGKWTFEWKGTDLPLECSEYAEWSYFFYLVGMEGEKMVWIKSASAEWCEAKEGNNITFNRK